MWTNNTNTNTNSNTTGGVGPDGLTDSERTRMRAAIVLHHAYTEHEPHADACITAQARALLAAMGEP